MADGVFQAVLEATRKQRQDGGEGCLMSDSIWLGGGGGACDWDLEVACCRTSTRMLYTTLYSARALAHVYYNSYAPSILLLKLINKLPWLTPTFAKARVPEAQCGPVV